MTPGATFAELLDAELGRAAGEAAAAPAAITGVAPDAPMPGPAYRSFVRFDIPFVATPAAYGAVPLPGLRAASTAGEARARLAIESAAAGSRDFSPADLRAAFRRLAREHHPDGHPYASDAEAAQWSGSFAAIERRYRAIAADLAARQ